MATTTITIPTSFFQQMNQFMVNVRKMQQLTNQFLQTQQRLPQAQNLYRAHHAVTSRMGRLLQVLRKTSANMQRTVDSMIRMMGTTAQTFMRGLSLAADALGPIIAASVAVTSVIVSATITAATISYRVMRWFWDKMVALGDSMLQDFLTSTGSFASIGGLRAFRAAFGGVFSDTSGLVSGMVQARGSQASQPYAALQMLGVRASADTADMMTQATIAVAEFMKHQQKGHELSLAMSMVFTSIFKPEELLRLEKLTEEEIRVMKENYERYKPLLKISEKAVQGWINFRLQVKAAGAQITAIIAEKLADPNAPFTQALTQLSKALVRFVKVFSEVVLTKANVDWLAKQIDEFARWMSGPGPMQAFDAFMKKVNDAVKSLQAAIDVIQKTINMFSGRTLSDHTVKALHGRRALARRVGIERPYGAPAAAYPEVTPIARYPGRARFAEKIGIARPPEAPRISPVRQGSSGVRHGSPNIRQGSPNVRQGSSGIRQGSSGTRQAPIEGIKPPTGTLRGGQVNSSDLYNAYKEKFKNSSLNGYVPKDGARWGIKTGSPDEWARLATSVSKQESGLNANAGGGGLNQFEQGDLARYGVRGNVNDPNAQVDALVNQWSGSIPKDGVVSQPAPGNAGPGDRWLGAGRYFGSMRDQGWHGKTQADVDKYLGPGGWGDRAQQSAGGGTSSVVGAPSGSPGQPQRSGDTSDLPPAMNAATGQAPDAFIVHHTGGGGTVQGVQNTLNQRGLGVEYVMDRDGKVYQIGQPGAANIMPESRYRKTPILGEGKPFLTNQNIVGMEVIAKDDKDVTPAQRDAAARFIRERYPNTPVYGHGEVNPGHKEPDEGKTIVDTVRAERAGVGQDQTGVPRLRLVTPSQPPPAWPTGPVPSIDASPTSRNPVDNFKVDNRSDMDVSHAKTSSENDTGSSLPAKDTKPSSEGKSEQVSRENKGDLLVKKEIPTEQKKSLSDSAKTNLQSQMDEYAQSHKKPEPVRQSIADEMPADL